MFRDVIEIAAVLREELVNITSDWRAGGAVAVAELFFCEFDGPRELRRVVVTVC